MLEKGKGPRIDKIHIIQLICGDLRSLIRAFIVLVANKVVKEKKLNMLQYARKQATILSTLVEKQFIFEL